MTEYFMILPFPASVRPVSSSLHNLSYDTLSQITPRGGGSLFVIQKVCLSPSTTLDSNPTIAHAGTLTNKLLPNKIEWRSLHEADTSKETALPCHSGRL